VDDLWNRLVKQWTPPSWWNLVITLPWVIGFAWFLYSGSVDRRIAAGEKTTSGTIRVHDIPNHDRYGYDYSVNGATLTAWQIPERDYQIGESVRVYYDPLDPANSSLSNFAANADDSIGPSVFCSVGTLIVALVIVFLKKRTGAARPYKS
jgi:hypothetical protein